MTKETTVEPKTYLSIRLDAESDEFGIVSVVAVQPRGWRDAWAVLRGTYAPRVMRRHAFTVAGMSRAIKKAWNADTMRAQMYQSNPLLDMLTKRDDA